MNYLRNGLLATGLLSILMVAAPAFAQSYYGNTGYTNAYYPQQSAQTYGNPMIYQVVNVPTYNSAPMYMSNYGYSPSYSGNMMQQSQYYPQQQRYNAPQQPQYRVPQYQQNQYYGPGYSYPEYDSSYAPYSNYYTTYPQQNMGYTGDTNALGSPLCNWQGYGRSDCSFNPHQWVYDPYSGTWH